jgi:hypothetical protein
MGNYSEKSTNIAIINDKFCDFSMGTTIESYSHAQQDRRKETNQVSSLLAQKGRSKA